MTRINANIPPDTLHRRHLIAELREITMVPASLSRSRRTRTDDQILSDIPGSFCLGKNHVKFFYNKLDFLKLRFSLLVTEMIRRGYVPDATRSVAFDGFPDKFYCGWKATEDDNLIVMERIIDRINQKPHLYSDHR